MRPGEWFDREFPERDDTTGQQLNSEAVTEGLERMWAAGPPVEHDHLFPPPPKGHDWRWALSPDEDVRMIRCAGFCGRLLPLVLVELK